MELVMPGKGRSKMNYFQIYFTYETEHEITFWARYSDTVFVQADKFEDACNKIKSRKIHQGRYGHPDRFHDFVDLTIR
jgi:REP element-mobilizing transposase RayT